MKRIGNYQKRILWRLNQNPVSKNSLESGYSSQVKSLKQRGLIESRSDNYIITSKGKKEYKKSSTRIY